MPTTNGWRMALADLRRVASVARKLEKVRGELNAAILTARASGETYRDIGKAAGLSHVTIRQIVTESDDG